MRGNVARQESPDSNLYYIEAWLLQALLVSHFTHHLKVSFNHVAVVKYNLSVFDILLLVHVQYIFIYTKVSDILLWKFQIILTLVTNNF